ncbi:non-ribosomal peptide synthetase [Methylobacter marinus]|uniref:non-ribosomal peptide synthetase n=1 Tax=Methylobacter marinus TaxID=34058 RepID=UPI0018DC2A27|nr:non-ribosomal peptide synthetase [Methylobacter marinus]
MSLYYPLTSAQASIWFAQMLDPENPAYNIGEYTEISGAIDPDLFRLAVSTVLDQSDSFHLRFITTEEGPRQYFSGDKNWAIHYLDFSTETDPYATAKGWMHEDMAQACDIVHGPISIFALIKIRSDFFIYYQRAHHLISDGFTGALFARKVVDIYSSMSGVKPLDDNTSGSWLDVLKNEENYRNSARYGRDRDYWIAQLKDRPGPVTLSGKQPEPIPCSQHIRKTDYLAYSTAETLRSLGAAHGASLTQVITAAVALYLNRFSGEEDIIIGIPVSARIGAKMRNIPGMMSNILPLRLRVDSGQNFGEFLSQTTRSMRDTLRHQSYRSEDLRQDFGLPPNGSHFYGMTVNAMVFDYVQSFAGYPARTHNLSNGPEFELSLNVYDNQSGFDLRFDFNANPLHYSEKSLATHMRRLLGLLARLASSTLDVPISRISLLEADELQRVLYDWNATQADYPQYNCVHELFEAQVRDTPDAPAVVFEDQTLSYAEVNARANRLAHYLRRSGVGPDVLVAICAERSLEMVVGLLGILKAGGAYVPLDPAYPADRLAYMLADAAPRVLLTQERLKGILPWTESRMIALDSDWRRIAEQPDTNLPPQSLGLTSRHLAYVIYTSGSTGQPKGAMNEHRGVVNRLNWMQKAYGLTADDAVLQKTPFSFDVSVWEFFWPLFTGARLVMAKPEGHKDPVYLSEIIQRQRITTLHFVPPMLQIFLEHGKAADCTSLRRVICSGEALPVALSNRFHELLTHSELHNLYGPTEAAIDVTAWACEAGTSTNSIPIGRPIDNTRIYILDAQGQPVPVGVPGELFIGGVQVGRGYLNRPELSAERFIADPFSSDPEARLYKTGDLVRWREDGSIEYLGRNDFQVKIRGFRIELGEIEARLAEHPQVRETAVLAREDGPGGKQLVAYYTGDADVTVDSLRAHLAETLPDYMVPAAFVHLAALPLSPNGKLDRKALPAPDAGALQTRQYEAPQGETEQALADIWAELLKIDRVGRHDNFFELGGHSLLAVTLIARMRQAGMATDVRELFAAPTLAGLAALADSGNASEQLVIPANRIPADATAITPDLLPLVSLEQADIDRITAAVPGGAANVQDIYPLAPLQEGILFHHLMESDGDAYLEPVLMAFDTQERQDGFLAALQAVIARHDILRTAVVWEDLPEPVQVVWREAKLKVEHIVIGPEAGKTAEQLLERYDTRHYRLDLRAAPLINGFTAYDPRKGRWLLLLLTHHLALDNTALGLLLEEIRMHQLGQGDQLPAPLPFRNFVAQARLGMKPEEHEAFFRGMLADVDEPAAPFGLLDVLGDGSRIQEANQTVATDLARRLREQSRTLGISAASLFHLAWATVLARTSGRDDVVFGTVLLGRMQSGEGADRMLGMFINTLPLRVQLAQGSVLEQVHEVQQRLASLLRHEHAPLSLAQRCSGVQAPAPLFSALLNYRHSQSEISADGAAWQGIEVLSDKERSNYPIVLSVDDLGEGFSLTAQTLPPAAPERLCAMMHTALENLLDALESAPDAAMRRIGVLPDAERRQVLYDWNATRADYPQDCCIHELFEAQVARTPEADAVVWDGGRLSYAELNARANRLAFQLEALGVMPDTVIGICVERSPEMIIGLLGILKAGGAYLPLDSSLPEDRLDFMLSDTNAGMVLTQKSLLAKFSGLGCACLTLDQLEGHADYPDMRPDAAVHSRHLAYVIYTSGSTGQPKGVQVEHRNLVNLITWHQKAFAVNPSSRATQLARFSFDACVWEIWPYLTAGASLYLLDNEETLLSSERLRDWLVRQEITIAFVPTPVAELLLDLAWPKSSALCWLLTGGDKLHRYPPSDLSFTVVNNYGPTEYTVVATSAAMPVKNNASILPPIGRPIANTRIYLLDAQGEPVPVGVAGEIHVAGDGVARGYLNRPDLNAERFIQDPFSNDPGARMYKTGDLGRWLEDGSIEFLGRNDFQVKIRGFRIELGEIEARLAEHPAVRETAVLAREDGPGDKRLVAYYTGDADVTVDSLRAHLAETLPEYMVPAAFVQLEALPLTANGKLDRKALPAPDASAVRGYEAPQGETEQALAAIWQDILQIERVGRQDNFFEMGGHSLLVVKLVREIKQQFEVELVLHDVFIAPVLSFLAERIIDAQLAQFDEDDLLQVMRSISDS